jgi:hypothetical protein
LGAFGGRGAEVKGEFQKKNIQRNGVDHLELVISKFAHSADWFGDFVLT